MEENVALDSKKQRKFVKSIKSIKKRIKKNEKSQPKKEEKVEPKKPFSMKLKDGKISKKKRRRERGLVYLSHIPHGFYEHQMTQYFKQFGVVTNCRTIRSKRTGNSKGFAFVEFREPAVGQIVAETMNNYLMGKRLIKAAYIPPEKQKRAFRKHWNSVNNPGSQLRLKIKKAYNADKDENGELKRARKLLSNFDRNKKKLSELGINYDFFTPVDIPEALLNQVIKQEKEDNDTVKEEQPETKPKKNKKGKQEQKENTKVVNNEKPQNAKQEANEKGKKNIENKTILNIEITKKGKKAETKGVSVAKVNKKEKVPVNEKQQKEKEQKLKAAGVKPAEQFIKLGDESGDESDSSYEFDSDEYEKMLEDDNSDLSSGESGPDDESRDDDSGASDEDNESDEEEVPPKKVKGKPSPKVIQPVQTKKQALKQPQKPQVKKQEQKKPVEAKRKAPQKPAISQKTKFEKLGQKPMKKQFKKK